MTRQRQETDAEFNAFLAGVDRALTEQFGPNHQEVLAARAGPVVSRFAWDAVDPPKRIDPG